MDYQYHAHLIEDSNLLNELNKNRLILILISIIFIAIFEFSALPVWLIFILIVLLIIFGVVLFKRRIKMSRSITARVSFGANKIIIDRKGDLEIIQLSDISSISKENNWKVNDGEDIKSNLVTFVINGTIQQMDLVFDSHYMIVQVENIGKIWKEKGISVTLPK